MVKTPAHELPVLGTAHHQKNWLRNLPSPSVLGELRRDMIPESYALLRVVALPAFDEILSNRCRGPRLCEEDLDRRDGT